MTEQQLEEGFSENLEATRRWDALDLVRCECARPLPCASHDDEGPKFICSGCDEHLVSWLDLEYNRIQDLEEAWK